MDARTPKSDLRDSLIDAVARQLSLAFVSIDTIAWRLKMSPDEVLGALNKLEQRHGIGKFIDVSAARNDVRVRLRESNGC